MDNARTRVDELKPSRFRHPERRIAPHSDRSARDTRERPLCALPGRAEPPRHIPEPVVSDGMHPLVGKGITLGFPYRRSAIVAASSARQTAPSSRYSYSVIARSRIANGRPGRALASRSPARTIAAGPFDAAFLVSRSAGSASTAARNPRCARIAAKSAAETGALPLVRTD
jgi:hypothetical protein